MPVPEQLVEPPVDHRVHTLRHVLAQHRIAPPCRELSRADPPELTARRDQEPLDPYIERTLSRHIFRACGRVRCAVLAECSGAEPLTSVAVGGG